MESGGISEQTQYPMTYQQPYVYHSAATVYGKIANVLCNFKLFMRQTFNFKNELFKKELSFSHNYCIT